MEFYPLVSHQNGKSDTAGLHHCEPSLLPAQTKLLPEFEIPEWDSAYAAHLQRRIERNPRDLRSHTQRVLLSLANNDVAAIFSALADLFIVLGKAGYKLRYSLLQQVGWAFEADEFSFFKHRLRSGLRAEEQLPRGRYSSLSLGGGENFPLVSQSEIAKYQHDDISLAFARQRLAVGEIIQAQELLESALESDPGNKQTCIELLSLYRENNFQQSFKRLYFLLSGRALAEPQRWQALDEYFKSS